MKPRSSTLIFLLTLSLLLAVAACGGREDQQQGAVREMAPEPQTARVRSGASNQGQQAADPGAVRALKDRVTLDGGGSAVELPADYPADVPLHPDGTPTQYVASRVTGAMTTLTVDDSAETTRNFYLREMSKRGWELEADKTLGTLTIVSASKDDRALAVTIEDKGSMTEVVLVESTKPGARR